MTWGDVGFVVLAVGSVPAAVGVFVANSMARATWFLLASFLGVAGVLLLLGGNFLGAILALMALGEMTIMVIFMLTLMGMNGSGLMAMSMVHNGRGSWMIALGTFALLATGILTTRWPRHAVTRASDDSHALGLSLMGPKMLVMMTFGVALFATMIAGTLLATHRGRYDRFGDDLAAPHPSDPIPGGLQ